MPLNHIIINLKRDLIRTFAVVDEWFDKELAIRTCRTSLASWSINEVLEHIMLSNHYLLILIEKGTKKALKAKRGKAISWPEGYSLSDPGLHQIADPDAFTWHTPDHHAPTGSKDMWEIRREIRDQLHQCLIILELLPNGEGILERTAMSVNNLGSLDIYQYVYFISLHAQRHLKQMQKIESQTIVHHDLNRLP